MPNTKVVGIIFPYILTPIPNLYDHSFPRYGQITFLTFRRPTTLTFDLKFWKYLSVTVYPYVIGWEMAEILHFEILRKHGQTRQSEMADLARRATSVCTKFHRDRLRNGWDITLWNFAKTRTNTQTDMGITIPRPPPMGGEVTNTHTNKHTNRHGHYNTSPSPYGGRGSNWNLDVHCYCRKLNNWLRRVTWAREFNILVV